jgi:Protein of unknown function (DUF3551)
MRVLVLAILAISTVSVTSSARAQTYDPAFPVCLHVWTRGNNYYDCSYTTLPQCNASASGRAAQCIINPYYAGATGPQGRDRRYRRAY